MHIIKKNVLTEINPSGNLYTSVGNIVSKTKTYISLYCSEESLIIYFRCEDNLYMDHNTYIKDNDFLYRQEVFEVFVSSGDSDPISYLEVEINPNNALFVGEINNPSGIGGDSKQLKILYSETLSLQHNVVVDDHKWSGEVVIPINLIERISKQKSNGVFMINFFRVVLKEKPSEINWVCNSYNSEFLCWKSTNSVGKPNFHITKYMSKITID